MLNVALTGNIAAGKSTVAELFRSWGATIIEADELVREVQAPGSAVLAAIAKRFGTAVIQRDGSLDRAALRAKVMGDPAALAKLNALVHPAVERRRQALLDEAWKRGDRIVVSVIPLLFEVLDPKQFDAVVLVDAPVPLRHARLRAMRGLSAEQADQMLAAQMPSAKKRKASDFVIDNDGDLERLTERARAAYDELERRARAKPPA